MEIITYRVRPGFAFTDHATPPQRHGPGDTLQLDAAVGDVAHQLERIDPEAAAKAAAEAEAKAAQADAAARAAEAEAAEADAAAKAAEAAIQPAT